MTSYKAQWKVKVKASQYWFQSNNIGIYRLSCDSVSSNEYFEIQSLCNKSSYRPTSELTHRKKSMTTISKNMTGLENQILE